MDIVNINILDYLRKKLIESTDAEDSNKFRISGIWDFNMRSQPSSQERVFIESGCLVATTGLGGSFRLGNRSPDEEYNLLSMDGRFVATSDRAIQVAILDSCYSIFQKKPQLEILLTGDTLVKSVKRAQIITNEVKQIAMQYSITNAKVLMVGVVNTIVECILSNEMDIILSDLEESYIGEKILGVKVQSGETNLGLIQESDIVVATGMTITTETLDDILYTSRSYKKPLLIYAQTGSNFAEEYINLGAKCVVAEQYPWYCIPGQSKIYVFRSSK